MYIQTADFAFAGKFFVIFVSATLATNKLIPDQPQFKQNFELTRFKVIPPDYNVANSAPIISNFVEEIKIFEKDYKEIVVANISDDKNNEMVTITIKVGCNCCYHTLNPSLPDTKQGSHDEWHVCF